MSEIVVRYSRAGGRPPADDERVEVRVDGTFSAQRTVGGARIGTFAGTLAEGEVATLRAEAAACLEAGELWLETPRDGATEMIELGDESRVTASLGSNARPGSPWGALVTHLRELLDRATEHPVAAVELDADARGARLVAVGPEPLDVDPGTIELRLVRLDATGVPVERRGSAAADPATTPPSWQRTDAGWSHELPFERPVELASGEWLQVWVTLTLRTDARRRGRLFAAVSGG